MNRPGKYLSRLLAIALLSVTSVPVSADTILGGALAGLGFGQDFVAAKVALDGSCQGLRAVNVQPPNFPLAGREETHLICEGFAAGNVRLAELALTFADDALVLAYARGNTASLEGRAGAALERWMQFSVSWDDRLVVDATKDEAWVMSAEAAHPNLFQWPNPYVGQNSRVAYDNAAKRPGALQFGRRLEALKPLFESWCAFTDLGQYSVWLLTEPEIQHQLDCYGVEYAGFPRKIEAVFGDGVLQQAWILTGSAEESRVRDALEVAFGKAIYADERWEIFDHGRVMLRKDKPEVLMLSDTLAPLYRAEYVDQGE